MAMRIDCSVDGYKKAWIDFREDRWRFKDRREILESTSDLKTLEIILGYIEDWSMKDVNGNQVPFDKDAGVDLLDDLDDSKMIPWIIGAWFEAKVERTYVPKKSSDGAEETS